MSTRLDVSNIYSGAYPPRCMLVEGLRDADLVDLQSIHASFQLDIRYATNNNFVNQAVYGQARAFLQRPAAEALVRVSCRLMERGYGLMIYDGYRPWAVTKKFWELTSPELHDFVANPEHGSKHNRGCAVDLTLYRLPSSSPSTSTSSSRGSSHVEMPCDFDDMTDKAHSEYAGDASLTAGTAEFEQQMNALQNRQVLIAAMEQEGDFKVQDNEWWHFNYKDWQEYPVLDIPFEEISR